MSPGLQPSAPDPNAAAGVVPAVEPEVQQEARKPFEWYRDLVRPAAVATVRTLTIYRAVILVSAAVFGIAYGRDSAMISGLFALNASDQMYLSLVLFLLGTQIFICARILELYVPLRLGVRRSHGLPGFLVRWLPLVRWGWVVLLAVVPIAFFAYRLFTLPNAAPGRLIIGISLALVISAMSIAVENVVSPAGSEQVLPIPILRDRLFPLGLHFPLSRLLAHTFAWIILRIDRTGCGFLVRDKANPFRHRVLTGHILALLSTGVLLIGYVLEKIFARFPGTHLGPGDVKAMIYALLTIALYGSALSFFCFLLDRHRFPVIKVAILLSFLFSLLPRNSHYYEMRPSQSPPPLSATALWSGDNEQVIVISSEGGGIQAAAWDTRVVLGIAEQLPERLRPKFVKSIRLLSGTSGGSTGAMFVQTLFDNPATVNAPMDQLKKISDAGVNGTVLSWIGFGLSYFDLTRPILPFVSYEVRDRGWGAERAWKKILTEDLSSHGDATLDQLRAGVDKGLRPLLVFNATVADLGMPLEITNFDLQKDPEDNFRAFHVLYPGKDLNLTTAVRLSASFPYVSPAPRPFWNGKPYMTKPYAITDGGLYDNFGVAGAYFTLQQATDHFQHAPPKPIVWIQVRLPNGSSGDADPLASTGLGPLITINNTKDTGQRSRADQLTDLAMKNLGKKLQVNKFDYPLKNAPLSWALTAAQVDHIELGWQKICDGYEQIRDVCTAIGGGAAECERAAKPWVAPDPSVCRQHIVR